MNGLSFESLMQSVFKPFLEQLGFAMQPVHVSGRYYRASFADRKCTLLITFEPGDEQTTVMLLTNGDDDLRSIDDPAKSPRLSHLNARYMGLVTASERADNEAFFGHQEPLDRAEQKLIKCAKDLRLVLPHYLASL